ncbi:MAG: uncharacterized protein A8A55_0895 [Amphiamblys sp. WSBS2006]|nr:MAG: uncharacterized protein A8A55_0895 [Amphiamblys sp. WSBS2006]
MKRGRAFYGRVQQFMGTIGYKGFTPDVLFSGLQDEGVCDVLEAMMDRGVDVLSREDCHLVSELCRDGVIPESMFYESKKHQDSCVGAFVLGEDETWTEDIGGDIGDETGEVWGVLDAIKYSLEEKEEAEEFDVGEYVSREEGVLSKMQASMLTGETRIINGELERMKKIVSFLQMGELKEEVPYRSVEEMYKAQIEMLLSGQTESDLETHREISSVLRETEARVFSALGTLRTRREALEGDLASIGLGLKHVCDLGEELGEVSAFRRNTASRLESLGSSSVQLSIPKDLWKENDRMLSGLEQEISKTEEEIGRACGVMELREKIREPLDNKKQLETQFELDNSVKDLSLKIQQIRQTE